MPSPTDDRVVVFCGSCVFLALRGSGGKALALLLSSQAPQKNAAQGMQIPFIPCIPAEQAFHAFCQARTRCDKARKLCRSVFQKGISRDRGDEGDKSRNGSNSSCEPFWARANPATALHSIVSDTMRISVYRSNSPAITFIAPRIASESAINPPRTCSSKLLKMGKQGGRTWMR